METRLRFCNKPKMLAVLATSMARLRALAGPLWRLACALLILSLRNHHLASGNTAGSTMRAMHWRRRRSGSCCVPWPCQVAAVMRCPRAKPDCILAWVVFRLLGLQLALRLRRWSSGLISSNVQCGGGWALLCASMVLMLMATDVWPRAWEDVRMPGTQL